MSLATRRQAMAIVLSDRACPATRTLGTILAELDISDEVLAVWLHLEHYPVKSLGQSILLTVPRSRDTFPLPRRAQRAESEDAFRVR